MDLSTMNVSMFTHFACVSLAECSTSKWHPNNQEELFRRRRRKARSATSFYSHYIFFSYLVHTPAHLLQSIHVYLDHSVDGALVAWR